MRIRSIKPEFWEDEDVALLPVAARLTFIGLWNLADDGGYMRSSLSAIAAALYRFESRTRRERHVSDAIERLTAAGMYESLDCGVHGRVIHLPKHQRLAGETRQVHTYSREHEAECTQTSTSERAPHIPAEERGASPHIPAHPRPRARRGLGEVEVGEVKDEGGGARVPPRGAPNGAEPHETTTKAIDSNIAMAGDASKPDGVRRAARRAVERHAPERLGEIGAAP